MGCFFLEDVEGVLLIVEVVVAGVECFIVVVVLWGLFGRWEGAEGERSILLQGD
jgi:hypothetical protein